MENLGSEIGQKMRHAVKAKLLELGTGSSSGYVDDELPDYVMIMVANKRSKQQMIEDLTLFLGSNTGEFVTWLHQVLQKLQEVSLPATLPPPKTSKRKASESSDTTHKKEKRKEKKSKKPGKGPASNSSSKSMEKPKATSSAAPSITDVFADQLIQKAKKTMQSEATVNVKKRERTPEAIRAQDETPENDFDIPTITQIAENTVEQTRRKELLELEEIQKKIYQAKRQLSKLTSDESEDEDFINLKADGEEFDDPDVRQTESIVDSTRNQAAYRNPSPIVFDLPARRVSSSSEGEPPEREKTPKKTSVKERLGSKPTAEVGKNVISLSANRRSEQEIYIPAFRRREMEKAKEMAVVKEPLKTRRMQESSVEVIRREKRNAKEPKVSLVKELKSSVRQRIGSRVIVAPPKPEFDEDAVDVSVSSVVKIKPRPVLPLGKQANKNLLLRAMAEAQKSTAGVMTQRGIEKKGRVAGKAGKVTANKANILIEVPRGNNDKSREDEYVPTPVTHHEQNDEVVYIPQTSCEEIDDDSEANAPNSGEDEQKRPQFVVTLDGIFKGIKADNIAKKKSLPKNVKERIVEKKIVSVEPRTRSTRKASPERKKETLEPVKKDELTPKKRSAEKEAPKDDEPPRKRRIRCSPIRFDLDSEKKDNKSPKSPSPSTPRKSHKTPEREPDKNTRIDGDGHTVTIRRIETKKYENLPSLLSSVTVPQASAKPKDRCKYFPNCTKGDSCEFIHPSMPCKSFPNCKFGEMCLYLHPKCKFDLTCSRHNCNFSHTPVISAAPPLASHVVPVHNYKMITQNLLPPLCKFYPKCSNTLCNFYHPKLCRFGKACMNKVECNFYHHDIPAVDKFKWVSTAPGTGSGQATSTFV
ncbi:zinc finger CCCH domain-containing protein 14 [Phlebotomus argentipes]|uniref:zinc finger CCCH domain-containing protein 14 n=1 Tax=Phlebotomus argentipes TaxID=94469 RepID=UPI002892AC25|nr:zinc finger CCCH domain-containing protein 14 [Phlebotomus argentipes]